VQLNMDRHSFVGVTLFNPVYGGEVLLIRVGRLLPRSWNRSLSRVFNQKIFHYWESSVGLWRLFFQMRSTLVVSASAAFLPQVTLWITSFYRDGFWLLASISEVFTVDWEVCRGTGEMGNPYSRRVLIQFHKQAWAG
jgi:hypothetical protein